jgi:hypothetical protein
MLSKLYTINNINAIVDQFDALNWGREQTELNKTDGNLLTGEYKIIPELINTPIGNFLESLGDIGEARFLWLYSGEHYTGHSDPDDRIHLVIKTNPDCYIIDLNKKEMTHLPVDGTVWYMNTDVKHTAANFGGKPRVHINVRVRLPKFKSPGWDLQVFGGKADWKQELYDGLMGYLNIAIKEKKITGIEKINERHMRVNCDVDTLKEITQIISDKGFIVTGNPV